MQTKEKNYLILIALHVFLGGLIYLIPSLSKIYGVVILAISLYFIFKTKNKNNEVLFAAAYIVGSEVFLRMTGGNINYEFGKYSISVLMFIGMLYSGFSKNAISYWVVLIALIPGIIIGTQTLNPEHINIRNTIMFNISGPISLGVCSLYCYFRTISFKQLSNLLLVMGLPLVSTVVYLVLYTPNLSFLNSTGSNFTTSGGFGPNQVSTALGLGMFIFFSRSLLESKSKLFLIVNFGLFALIAYRGLITFSRGGMITGFVMMFALLGVIFWNSKKGGRGKLLFLAPFLFGAFILVWGYTELKTGGLISKRYANQDAIGRTKESNFTGREEIAAEEIGAFLENPIWGIGAGKATEYRFDKTNDLVASHSEITRMLAEHGAFGVLILLLLITTPLLLYLGNKQHIFLLSFVLFWILTINHAAMRIAAPSFIYALSLLKVQFENEENTVHRQ
jgi:hypothetical protein